MKIKTQVPNKRNKWLELAVIPFLLLFVCFVLFVHFTNGYERLENLYIFWILILLFLISWIFPLFFCKSDVVEIEVPDSIIVENFQYEDSEGRMHSITSNEKLICNIENKRD
jgi:hypothetical protein